MVMVAFQRFAASVHSYFHFHFMRLLHAFLFQPCGLRYDALDFYYGHNVYSIPNGGFFKSIWGWYPSNIFRILSSYRFLAAILNQKVNDDLMICHANSYDAWLISLLCLLASEYEACSHLTSCAP